MESAARESNIKEERSNKKEEVVTSGPLGLASLSETLSPSLSQTSSTNECEALRLEIRNSRPLITHSQISYVRLSLLTPKTADNDGTNYTRLSINMDLSINNEHKFDKFKWRLTDRRREYYPNLPVGWETDATYQPAWDLFNSLTTPRWIGKACYRLDRREQAQKLKLVPFTAMVAWVENETIQYQLWIESAEIAGSFNIDTASKHYTAASEPVKNFKPTGFRLFKV